MIACTLDAPIPILGTPAWWARGHVGGIDINHSIRAIGKWSMCLAICIISLCIACVATTLGCKQLGLSVHKAFAPESFATTRRARQAHGEVVTTHLSED